MATASVHLAGDHDPPSSSWSALRQCLMSRPVEVLTSPGQSMADEIRSIGVKRLKHLEAQNNRLRRALSDLTLDKPANPKLTSQPDHPTGADQTESVYLAGDHLHKIGEWKRNSSR